MNDQFSNDSISSTTSTDSTDFTEVKTGKGSIWVGSLVCGAVPALIVGFGAICYLTGYKEALNEARPTIVHGNQTVNNQKFYQITPSISSNNNNNQK